MKPTIRSITTLDDVVSTLAVSGYSISEIEELTKTLNDDSEAMGNIDFLISSKQLEMSHCLSKEWIVGKLKRLAEGPDALAAVNALKVLSEIAG